MIQHLMSLVIKKLPHPFIVFILLSLLILSACSPHSGTGYWQTQGSNSLNISSINITFEGTADFYTQGKKEAIYRCFWSAATEKSMRLQCVNANDVSKEDIYLFMNLDKKNAQLLLNDKIVAQFSRIEQPPIVSSKEKN